MHSEIEKVTPSIAVAYLERNTSNRNMSHNRVTAMAEAMKRGEWVFNGDSIRFSDDGVLLDGQHRLAAIVKSGTAQNLLVIRGLPKSVFSTIDTGSARTAAEVIGLAGVKNQNVAAAGAKLYLLWRAYGSPLDRGSKYSFSHEQILSFCRDNDLLSRAASYSSSNSFLKKFMTSSIACFVYLAISEISEEMAVSFLDDVSNRAESSSGNPTILLREKLLEMSGSKAKTTKKDKIALILKAFRFWRSGRRVKQLKVATNGLLVESDIFSVGISDKEMFA